MLAGVLLVSNLGEAHRNLKIINPLLVGLPPDRGNLHQMAVGGWTVVLISGRLPLAGMPFVISRNRR